MTGGILKFGFLFGGELKSEIAIVLTTVAICIFLPLLAVFSLGAEVVQFLARVPSTEEAMTQGFYLGGDIPGNTYAWGNCTWWSFTMRLWAGSPIPSNWGNANTWDDRARAAGYNVDHTPRVGAVYQTDAGQYGHVAYVISVDYNGGFTISEMNNVGLNIVNTRKFDGSAAAYSSFIHTKKGAGPWMPISIPLEKQYLNLKSQLPL